MERDLFEPDQFPYNFDTSGQLPFEFPLQLLPTDQYSHWAGLRQTTSTPGPTTYTDNDFQFAEGGSFQPLQESTSTQHVPQSALNEGYRTQSAFAQAVDDQLHPTEPLNHSSVDAEIVSHQEVPRRSNFTSYSESTWNAHKARIKQLYMDDFKSLEDTMKYMADNHNFLASKKMYKDKIKEWGWYKNLPSAMASWMFQKWDQRMKEKGSDTKFEMGGRIWTSSQVLKRVQKTAGQQFEDISEGIERSSVETLLQNRAELIADATTPFGVTYSTPYTIASRHQTPIHGAATPSPPDIEIVSSSVVSRQTDRWTPLATPHAPRKHHLATRWQNYSRTDIDTLQREAHELACQGKNVEAERKFREALVGLENLLPPTHEDTNAVAYHLASFYAQHGRMREADGVLSRVGEQHLDRWGITHKKTRTHIHRVAELFHSWDRQPDAIAFLCRAFSYYDRLFSTPDTGRTTSGSIQSSPLIVQRPNETLRIQSAEPAEPDHELEGSNEMEAEQPPTELAIKVEELDGSSLLSLIDQCEKCPEQLGEETLQAYRTVINCCQAQENKHMLPVALERSALAFGKIFDSYDRKAKVVLDSAVELASAHLVSGNDEVAADMFLRIESEAVESPGPDNHATIGILVDIGKLYQDQKGWSDACPWFEHALAASITASGLESKDTKRLEAALENERYETSFPTFEAFEESLRRMGPSHHMRNAFPMI